MLSSNSSGLLYLISSGGVRTVTSKIKEPNSFSSTGSNLGSLSVDSLAKSITSSNKGFIPNG